MSERPGDTRTPEGSGSSFVGCGCVSTLALFIVVTIIMGAVGVSTDDDLLIALWLLSGSGMVFFMLVAAFKPRAPSVGEPHTPSVSESHTPSVRELRAMPYEEYLQTPHWKRKREERLRAVGYRCQLCNRPASKVILDVHHRTYERRGEERDEDLTVLCRECHYRHHEHGPRGH
jgi:hypothetical protein